MGNTGASRWTDLKEDVRFEFPWKEIQEGERVVIYGGGVVGKTYLAQILSCTRISFVAICDQKPQNTNITSVPVLNRTNLQNISQDKYDTILIAVERKELADEIKKSLVSDGISEEKIRWYNPARKKIGMMHKNYQAYLIPDIEPMRLKRSSNTKIRLNLLIPSLEQKDIFGGISTALRFMERLRIELNCSARIITTNKPYKKTTSVLMDGYEWVDCKDDSDSLLQIISMPFYERDQKSLFVGKNDYFIATFWTTAYILSETIRWQSKVYGEPIKPLIYFIQDYEPMFYPWSAREVLARSTYRLGIPTYAIINSKTLEEFLSNNGYMFSRKWSFVPKLNKTLGEYLPSNLNTRRRKQMVIYGRPSKPRNAFSIILYVLEKWAKSQIDAKEWNLVSVGESHENIEVGEGIILRSVGKLTLKEYADLMLESYVGISLMISPHPSYPPLEMSTFGVKTITNSYESKNLTGFNENILSVNIEDVDEIAKELCNICSSYDKVGKISINNSYVHYTDEFDQIPILLKEALDRKIEY